jgi:hypothetical protein
MPLGSPEVEVLRYPEEYAAERVVELADHSYQTS